MRKLQFTIFLISLLSLIACTEIKDPLVTYTEMINQSNLRKEIISTYPNGSEKAVIFFCKDSADNNAVKELHYYESGEKQVEGTIKNSQKHGTWTFYYENGTIWSTGNFKDGESIGCFTVYNSDGSIKVKSYYEEGKKVKEEIYNKGKLKETVNLD